VTDGKSFSDADLDVLRWAYKHGRELARRMPLYRGEVIAGHPKFPEGSEAIARYAEGPVPTDTPNIKYTEADDIAINELIKQTGEFHLYSRNRKHTN
jgi:alcohol oxidase